MKGLKATLIQEDVIEYLCKFGNEEHFQVELTTNKNKKHRGFAFVTIFNEDVYNKIASQDHILDDSKLEIKDALSKYDIIEQERLLTIVPRKIFIGGIPQNTTKQELLNYFGKYGPIEDLNVTFKRENKGKGFGFLLFKNNKSMEDVLADYDNHKIRDVWFECQIAKPKFSENCTDNSFDGQLKDLNSSENLDEKTGNSQSIDSPKLDKALKRKIERKKKSKAKKASKQNQLISDDGSNENFYHSSENFYGQIVNPFFMYNFANNCANAPHQVNERKSVDVCSSQATGMENNFENGIRKHSTYSEGMSSMSAYIYQRKDNQLNTLSQFEGYQQPSNNGEPVPQSMYCNNYNVSHQLSQVDAQNVNYFNNNPPIETDNRNVFYQKSNNQTFCFENPSQYNDQSIDDRVSNCTSEIYKNEFKADMSRNLVKDQQKQNMIDQKLPECFSSYKHIDSLECRVDLMLDQKEPNEDNGFIKNGCKNRINNQFCYNSNDCSINKGSTTGSDNEDMPSADFDLNSELNQNMRFISDWLYCDDAEI